MCLQLPPGHSSTGISLQLSQPERAALATLLVCGFGLEGVCRNVQLLMDMDMVGFILGL